MNIKIKSLEIAQFKGIKNLSLSLDGLNAEIKGCNGSGKTSVYDAFCWCLFGKDSSGASDFDVKPMGMDGRERGTDTSVVCVLDIDGKEQKFSRTLHEKFKTTPGESDPVYMGDETVCSIDDIPKKVSEYKSAVSLLIGDDELFKLITIHGAFMAMHWEMRRKYLMSIAGGNPDDEIKARPEFSGIDEVLRGKTADEAKKRLRGELKMYNDELNSIPSRMDEARKLLSGISESEYKIAIAEKDRLSAEIDSITSQMSGGFEAFKAANELIQRERSLALALSDVTMNIQNGNLKIRHKFETDLQTAMSACDSFKREIERLTSEIFDNERDCEVLKADREKLLAEWHSENDKPYVEPEFDHSCPYCGQELPVDKVSEIMINMANDFYRKRDEKLDSISACGKTISKKIEILNNEHDHLVESLNAKNEALDRAMEKYREMSEQKPDFINASDDPEYKRISDELESVREQMGKTKDSVDDRNALVEKRSALADELSALNEKIASYTLTKKSAERIEQLEARQLELGTIVAKIGGQLELLRAYTLAVCSVVEERINSLFTNIRWKLFRENKNDTIEPCCEATVNGVTYGRGLNNAACINAGIEIIRVISKEYNITAPCFVDNAEAVNSLAYTGGQMIKLTVSNDKELVLIKED